MECVETGKVREDLFYRLSVVQLNIPPLRERKEDISILTEYFIHLFNKKMKMDILSVDEEVEDIFQNHHWKGNVRELKNIMEGAFNIASGRMIRKKDLPEYLIKPTLLSQEDEHFSLSRRKLDFEGNISLETEVAQFEKHLIEMVLDSSANLSEAARILGISRQSLNYKLEKYNLK